MTALVISMAKQAVADRKGVTALEYALIASAVAAVILAAFQGLFGRLSGFIDGISFT
jgi:Flp pilus assembly pilin Flp